MASFGRPPPSLTTLRRAAGSVVTVNAYEQGRVAETLTPAPAAMSAPSAASEMPTWKHGPRDIRGRLYGDTLKLTSAPNPRMLANAILENLTGVFHDETRWDAARTLKHELQERPRMVIVDEAQNAGLDCIAWLRWLHEEVPGRLTLLLVGGPQVRAPGDAIATADASDLSTDRVSRVAREVGARDDPIVSPDVRTRR